MHQNSKRYHQFYKWRWFFIIDFDILYRRWIWSFIWWNFIFIIWHTFMSYDVIKVIYEQLLVCHMAKNSAGGETGANFWYIPSLRCIDGDYEVSCDETSYSSYGMGICHMMPWCRMMIIWSSYLCATMAKNGASGKTGANFSVQHLSGV